MPKTKKAKEPKTTKKEELVELIKSKAFGLFEREPRTGLRASAVEELAEEIEKL